jgi:hypothetical protein
VNRAAAAATLLVLVGVGYEVVCGLVPFTDCRGCHGTGQRRSAVGRECRRCARCRGTGVRLRAGRRVYDLIHRAYRRQTFR